MSNPNKTDFIAANTKHCDDCGTLIIRTSQGNLSWKHLKRCKKCQRSTVTQRIYDSQQGNMFWQALAYGEIPQKLRQKYELRKQQVRNLNLGESS